MDYRLVIFKGQMILSLLVVALVVQWRLFGDEVRPVHLPTKKRRAQRCHQVNQTGLFRSVPWCSPVRPYGFRTSELGRKDEMNEFRNQLRRPGLPGVKVRLSLKESTTPDNIGQANLSQRFPN